MKISLIKGAYTATVQPSRTIRFGSSNQVSPQRLQAVFQQFNLKNALTYVYDGTHQLGSLGRNTQGNLIVNLSQFDHPIIRAEEIRMVHQIETTQNRFLTEPEKAFMTHKHLNVIVDRSSGAIHPTLVASTYAFDAKAIPTADYVQAIDGFLQNLLQNFRLDTTLKQIVRK